MALVLSHPGSDALCMCGWWTRKWFCFHRTWELDKNHRPPCPCEEAVCHWLSGALLWATLFSDYELTTNWLKMRSDQFPTLFALSWRWPCGRLLSDQHSDSVLTEARSFLIHTSRLLQIRLRSHKAAYRWRLKWQNLTKSHLQEVVNGLPVPPTAIYPSAGESYGGNSFNTDGCKEGAAYLISGSFHNFPFRNHSARSIIVQHYRWGD